MLKLFKVLLGKDFTPDKVIQDVLEKVPQYPTVIIGYWGTFSGTLGIFGILLLISISS